MGVSEGDCQGLGRKGDQENGDEVSDEGSFDESYFVGVGLIVYTVRDGVRFREGIVGKFYTQVSILSHCGAVTWNSPPLYDLMVSTALGFAFLIL